MTIEEKIIEKQEKRGQDLSAIRNADVFISEVDEIIAFNNTYLFGDGSDFGIDRFFYNYYNELNISVGRTTNRPNLLTATEATWMDLFETAIRDEGDDAQGFYPPSSGLGANELNTDSNFFSDNGDGGETTGGLVGELQNIDSAIGDAASPQGACRPDPHTGSGLLFERTKDNSPCPSDPLLYGNGSADTPDAYPSSDRTNLLNSLTNSINTIDDLIAALNNGINDLEAVQEGENEIFNSNTLLQQSPPFSDITFMQGYITDLNDFKNDLQEQYDYFSQFTAGSDISGQSGYVKSEFDNRLTTGLPTIYNGLISLLQSRAIDIPPLLGPMDLSDGLRRWRFFWIREQIDKPISPMISKKGALSSLEGAELSVVSSNDALDLLLGDLEQYILKPVMFSAYWNPRIDGETGEIIQQRISMVWQGSTFANKYKIYRKDITAGSSLDNEQWDDVFPVEHAVLNEETQMVLTIANDFDVDAGKRYQYRVQTLDADVSGAFPRIDSFETSSLQSDIYVFVTAYSSIEDGLITFSEPTGLTSNQFVLIEDSESNLSLHKIVLVRNDLQLQLEDDTVNDGSLGFIYRAPTIVEI